MSIFPRRVPDRGLTVRQAAGVPLGTLKQVLAGLKKADTSPGAIVLAGPPRHEVARTPEDALRILAGLTYPPLDGISRTHERYAPVMRAVNAATGTTGLGDYWRTPARFIFRDLGGTR